jgi:hypothetical protein
VDERSEKPRANVYFDGFNFYYGCFSNRGRDHWKPYKWLDLSRFIKNVFPHHSIRRIRYFTALVKPTPDDPDKQERQLTYLRALRTLPNLAIHEGRFSRTAKWRWEADLASFVPPHSPKLADPIKFVPIIEEEEKGSDVNLASYLLVDAFLNEYDVAIVVSNDSDLAEPIKLVRTVLGRKVILLNPRAKTATDLRNIADGYRSVRLGPIIASQFPDELDDAHGTITRPEAWQNSNAAFEPESD